MLTAIWNVQVNGSTLSFAASGLKNRSEVHSAAEKYYHNNVIVLNRVRFVK